MFYKSTKTYTHAQGLSCAFRQWRADSHCKFLHGYALEVKIEFAAGSLDSRNWVVDFGGLKKVKSWLEETFDHKTLVAHDDPEMEWFLGAKQRGLIDLKVVVNTGCEAFAEMIYNYVKQFVLENYGARVRVHSVEVREHQGNSAIVHV